MLGRRASGFALACAVLAVTVAGMCLSSCGPSGERATGSSGPSAAARSFSAPPSRPAPAATGLPSPTPPAAQLPGLVGAVGDSLTSGFDVGLEFGAFPEHSWVVGTADGDGVESHLERLLALGADPMVVNASRPGAPSAEGEDQARRIVERARRLPNGALAYVTFEMGANDICHAVPTDPVTYEERIRAAVDVLRDGLPEGSTLLLLSVPDVPRLRELQADIPAALEVLRRYRICWSALGDDADTEAIREITRAYNHSIVAICDQLAGSPIDCRHDQGGLPEQSLFGADFGPADLSPLDHFHPSLKGQARIAGVTWGLTPWGQP